MEASQKAFSKIQKLIRELNDFNPKPVFQGA